MAVADQSKAEHMLSTIDNPFDPYIQFDEWNAYDQSLGYNSLAYLDRVAVTSDTLSEADQVQEIEEAINEIVLKDPTHKFIRIIEPAYR